VSFSSSDLLKILRADGWFVVTQRGSHMKLKHSTKPGAVTVPHPKKDLPIGTVKSVFLQAGLPWPP